MKEEREDYVKQGGRTMKEGRKEGRTIGRKEGDGRRDGTDKLDENLGSTSRRASNVHGGAFPSDMGKVVWWSAYLLIFFTFLGSFLPRTLIR
jgi:hypothetical protein